MARKNVRLVEPGDIVVVAQQEGGEVVRSVSVIMHLANGTDVVVDCPGEVTLDSHKKLSEKLQKQVDSLSSQAK